MSEKKARTRRKTNGKINSAPTKTLLAHFKPTTTSVEPEPESPPAPIAKPVSKNVYNARVISRTSSFPEASTTSLTGKRRRAESDSPPTTPARPRSRSPLFIPSSSPPQQRSSSLLILSSSPPQSSGTPSRTGSPAPRPSSPVFIPSSSSPMIQPRNPTIIVDDDSPLSSPPSSPLTLDGEKTDSDGLGLTTHSFFANARAKAKAKGKPVPNKGKDKLKTGRVIGSQDTPIEIGGEEEGRPKPAVHAFFKPRKAAASSPDAQGSKGNFKGGVDPPWPTLDSIHAGRSTESIGEIVCPVPRRRVILSKTSISDEATRAWVGMHRRSQAEDDILDLSATQVDAWAGLRHPRDDGEGLPEDHAKDPAIARFNDPTRAFEQPSRSEEILGNGAEVGLIKEWLNKLALKRKEDEEREIQEAIEAQQKINEEEQGQETGKKRKKDQKEKAPVVIQRDRIVRSVAKPKRRAKPNENEYDPEMIDDDFIDDEEEDPNQVQIQYNTLGNTLVVCGGVGSGKSATIHACAQELGRTVFEIYPGIGKRGIGANGLAAWVGDAGMNHLVNGKTNEEISQSVILLDQVDMWFEQDAQYWSTIRNLINESRRGVILTTNDMYAFPADALPVHMYHELDQVEPGLASSYLYAQTRAALLGQAGGTETEADVLRRLPSRQAFRELYHKTALAPRLPGFAMQDMPLHPHPSQMDRLRDLGRALEEIKFWVIHGRNCQEREEKEPLDVREAWDACGYDVVESLGDWSQPQVVKHLGKADSTNGMRLGQFADTLSWVDAHLERRWGRQLEAAEIDRYAPGPDDQAHYKMIELCKPFKQESFGIAEYCADADIALAALCLARRRLERGGAGGSARLSLKSPVHFSARWLEEERSEYQDRALTFLEKYILSEATPQLPRPAVVLDVLPVVHRIVEADNEFEKEAEKGPGQRGGRPRRATAKAQKYIRYLTLHTPDKQAKALALVKETEYRLM
ncbi:unnamed protein product [Rhizoctonia solani]|uniref:Uncharacterized protein n=3 Tax=Rhizoctonia solani TaxID=456999 RepID=A0A8H3BDK2_9AGAM|nr:HLH domain protein, putative [Rhizoctonia solani AG-3 Rhs1AP]KEP50329.1 putative HLH domain protein [Rhizoctonia solani 123E]CAE6454302.1 unnamed protein product [Rhizoctonia solani]CAE6507333.1 unnamed protein product [Rhizoctonia solani]